MCLRKPSLSIFFDNKNEGAGPWIPLTGSRLLARKRERDSTIARTRNSATFPFFVFQNDTMQVVWQYHVEEPVSAAGVLPDHDAIRGSRPLYLVQRDAQPRPTSRNQEAEPPLQTWDILNQQVGTLFILAGLEERGRFNRSRVMFVFRRCARCRRGAEPPRLVGSWTGPMMCETDVGGKLWCNTSHCAADNMIIRGGRIRCDGTRLTYA